MQKAVIVNGDTCNEDLFMRLSMSVKDTIISHISQDFESIDYRGQAAKIITDHYFNKLPKQVQALVKDTNKVQHIKNSTIPSRGHIPQTCVKGDFPYAMDEALHDRIDELDKLQKEQSQKHSIARKALYDAFAGITTRKQLIELFPQFEKYCPDEFGRTKGTPMCIDVMPAVTAAGWPKEKKQ